jgi:hypothetical protein
LNRRPPAPKAALDGTGNPALPVPFLCSQHIAKDCCGLSSRNGTLVSLGWATTAAQEIDATPSCQDRPARIDAQEDGGAATVGTLERGGYTRVSPCCRHRARHPGRRAQAADLRLSREPLGYPEHALIWPGNNALPSPALELPADNVRAGGQCRQLHLCHCPR